MIDVINTYKINRFHKINKYSKEMQSRRMMKNQMDQKMNRVITLTGVSKQLSGSLACCCCFAYESGTDGS